jgi:hypothetical protein
MHEKIDQKTFYHLKTLFNIAYYIVKNNKPFSDFERLLELTGKLGVELKDKYKN